MDASTINSTSIQIHVAGPDTLLNTPDDVNVPETVFYNPSTMKAQVTANLAADTPYILTANGSMIKSADAMNLTLDSWVATSPRTAGWLITVAALFLLGVFAILLSVLR